MRILILQQVAVEGPGALAPFFHHAGITVDVRRMDRGDPLPASLDGWDGLVLLGGPMNVDEAARYPFLADEVRLLQAALASETPVLGICLGAQLLAKAGEARVWHGRTPERGWLPVTLTAEGVVDPALGHLPRTCTVFQWHGDSFDLPAGALRLASSAQYANQAFRLGPRAYGLQFHLEFTEPMVRAVVEAAASELRPGEGEHILAETASHLPALEPLAPAVFRPIFAARRVAATPGRGAIR